MKKISTANCRDLLVDFFKKNTFLFNSVFGRDPTEDEKSLIGKPGNWKRYTKAKVGQDSDWRIGDNFTIYHVDGTHTEEPYTNFTVERGFWCEGFEGQLAYLVLERPNGELAISEYIGD